MDYGSKQEATMVAKTLLKNVIARHSVPQELQSDQGRNFDSEVCK